MLNRVTRMCLNSRHHSELMIGMFRGRLSKGSCNVGFFGDVMQAISQFFSSKLYFYLINESISRT